MHREDLAWSKWYHLDGEIVGTDERHPLFCQPERATFIDAGLSLEIIVLKFNTWNTAYSFN